MKTFETQKLKKEEDFIAELKAMKFTQNEVAHGLSRTKLEYRLNDNAERIAYMVDSILALRSGFEFIKLGDAKNLTKLRGIRTEEAPPSDEEIEKKEQAKKVCEENERIRIKKESEVAKRIAIEYLLDSKFETLVRENAVWLEESITRVANTFDGGEKYGDYYSRDNGRGGDKHIVVKAHFNADKTCRIMCDKICKSCNLNGLQYDIVCGSLESKIKQICEDMTIEKTGED